MPDWKTISGNPSHTITLDTGKWHQEEISCFERLRSDKDLEKIIARYPVRESGILGVIASAFELNRKNYQDTLIGRVRTDANLAVKLKQLIQPLADALTEITNVENT